MNDHPHRTGFVGDDRLAYAASRRRFEPGEPLAFDEAYRLAHLPLVAPGHPAAIRERAGQSYRDGRYPEWRHALVAPVDWPQLAASPAFQALEDEMGRASFAGKIAWQLGRQRRPVLHATLASGLEADRIGACAAALSPVLARMGRLRMRLGGPLVGNRNWGRIYLPAYPALVDGEDAFAKMQDAIGAGRSGFYGVGYWHLTDPLDAPEAADLSAILDRWRCEVVAELDLAAVILHATRDDLVLSGRPLATISTGSGRVELHPLEK